MSDVTIPKATSEEAKYLGKGVHLVTLTDIKNHTDRNGIPLTSKAGDSALRFYMKDKDNSLFIDTIYYGREEVQWALDKLMTAIGVDNQNRQVDPSEVIGKKVYIAIKEVIFVTDQGEPIYKDNGEQKIYLNRHKYYQFVEGAMIPSVEAHQLSTDKVIATPPAPPTVPEVAEEPPFAEEAKTVEADTKLSDVVGEDVKDVLPDKKEEPAKEADDTEDGW